MARLVILLHISEAALARVLAILSHHLIRDTDETKKIKPCLYTWSVFFVSMYVIIS